MFAVLITLTVIEIALVIGVLAVYLVQIARSLRTIAGHLGKVDFGVRAIESQCMPIGPALTRINGQLTGIADALGDVAGLAGAGDGDRRRRG